MQTTLFDHIEHFEVLCNKLTKLLVGSHALAKACSDNFDYALKLRTGEVIRFSEARLISSGWIHLDVMEPDCQPAGPSLPYPADRGVDVRIADIVWVMDAPEGS
jgi:hypothetical protein